MNVVVTAGYGRSLHAIALIHELAARGHRVVAALEVTVLSATRARGYLRQLGWRRLVGKVRARFGHPGGSLADEVTYVDALVRERGIPSRTIADACGAVGARHVRVGSLNDASALAALRAAAADLVTYAGGGILRPEFLAIPRLGVLNVHGGPLPAFRGMNAAEWAVLHGVAPACAAHWVETGIDTGPVLLQRVVAPLGMTTVSKLRGYMTRLSVEVMLEAVDLVASERARPVPQAKADGRLFHVMAEPLLEVVERQLSAGPRSWRDPAGFTFAGGARRA